MNGKVLIIFPFHILHTTIIVVVFSPSVIKYFPWHWYSSVWSCLEAHSACQHEVKYFTEYFCLFSFVCISSTIVYSCRPSSILIRPHILELKMASLSRCSQCSHGELNFHVFDSRVVQISPDIIIVHSIYQPLQSIHICSSLPPRMLAAGITQWLFGQLLIGAKRNTKVWFFLVLCVFLILHAYVAQILRAWLSICS